jgi:hypothetical protein
MNDSETKIEEQAGKTPAVSEATEEIIIKQRGELVKVVRGQGGKFIKQHKSMPKSADMTRLFRTLMSQPIADSNGKLTKGGVIRARKVFDNMFAIASADPFQPVLDKSGNAVLDAKGVPITYFDAKSAMASTQAFKELFLRTYGMPSKSDEEIEAAKLQGVKIVILQHPELMDKNVVEDKPREALKPAFIEAEIIENK